jgi:uncharacterized protein (DUF362 family)
MIRKMTRRTFWQRAIGFSVFGHLLSNFPAICLPSDLSAPRKRLPNPFMENGKPIVMVVRGTDFPSMLKKGMEILGGFDRFGKDNAIHIKPNFVSASPYPTTTDGNSILATVELLKNDGFKDITIAEWGSSLGAMAGQTATEGFKYYGLDRKAEMGGFKIKDLIRDETVQVTDKRWIAMPSVGVRKSVYETPLIINMPTLKQHSQIQLSCALKNTMGQVDKQSRNTMHGQGLPYRSGNRSNSLRMSPLALAEIASAVNPELTIVDARLGLGRSHHIESGGLSIKPGRIIISGDALAADLVSAEVLEECYQGFQAEMVSTHFHHAGTLGFGAKTIDDVVIKEASV